MKLIGGIYYQKDRKKWLFSYMHAGVRTYLRFNTKKEAEEKQIEVSASLLRGENIVPAKITVAEWVVLWLKQKKPDLKRSSFERMKESAALLEEIGSIKLSKLTPLDCRRLYTKLRDRGYSSSSVNKVHKILYGAYKQAYKDGVLNNNLMEKVDAPRVAKTSLDVFTDEEMGKILETASHTTKYAIILVAVTTGAREGELLALHWSEVDLLNGVVEIKYTKAHDREEFTTPKTTAGTRKIPLPKITVDLLRGMPREFPLVFATKAGTAITHSNLNRAWKAIVEASGVPYRKFHTLRHTYATKMMATGISVLELARILGHSSPSVTMNVYGHNSPDYRDIASQKAGLAFEKYHIVANLLPKSKED